MLYRRHLRACAHRREKRRYWRCHCPIWFDARVGGHRVCRSMHLTDWDQAQLLTQEWINGATANSQASPLGMPEKEEPISLEKAWKKFIAQAEARNLSSATIYKYDLLRRRMVGFAQTQGITALRDLDLERLEVFLAEGKEGALSRLKKLERLKAFFRFAFERRWITDNPVRLLRPPKVRPRPTLPFTQEEMAAILAAVDRFPDKSGKTGRPNSVRLRAFLLTLRYTGLRIGDATSLTLDRLVGNKIFLRTQKTGQEVFCVVPAFVADALESVPRLSDRYFFWTGKSTLHTAIGSWQRTLRKLFKLANIPKGHAHRFRDTFAVELLLAGVPTEEVAVLLGHSNIEITQQHYSPWVRSRQQQLEVHLERAWDRDPMVILHMKTSPTLDGHKSGLPN